MANISAYLAKILGARYGKDVRQSIHDAINAVNASAEGSAAEAAKSAAAAATSAANLKNVELQAEATTEKLGAVKYDGSSIKKNETGQLYVEDVTEGKVSFEEAGTRENINTDENMGTLFGKIKKWFSDLKTVAFTGRYADLTGKPAIVNNLLATVAGNLLDAMQGKILDDKIKAISTKLTNQVLNFDEVFIPNTENLTIIAEWPRAACRYGNIVMLSFGATILHNAGVDLATVTLRPFMVAYVTELNATFINSDNGIMNGWPELGSVYIHIVYITKD